MAQSPTAMSIHDLEDALEKGLIDIHTFRTGRRPLMTKETIIALVLSRFKDNRHD